jgi:hypothetical protein
MFLVKNFWQCHIILGYLAQILYLCQRIEFGLTLDYQQIK